MEVPTFRMLKKEDMESVLQLMQELQPNIGGSRDPFMYRALCNEALVDERVVFIVGDEQSKIISFYLAIIDRNRWRSAFMLRHPLVALKMVARRFFNQLTKVLKKASAEATDTQMNIPDISQYVSPSSTNRSWKDSSPRIAKILFDGVAVSHQGRYIAKGMREYMYKVLGAKGVRRMDAIILSHNIRPIRVSHKLGFKIYRQDGSLFVTKDLP